MKEGRLKVLQINLNTTAAATESALKLAQELEVDLLVCQEPWLAPREPNTPYTRSITSPDFVQILPALPPPFLRPRTLIYVSRFLDIQVNTRQDLSLDPDLLIIDVSGQGFQF